MSNVTENVCHCANLLRDGLMFLKVLEVQDCQSEDTLTGSEIVFLCC